MKEFQCGSPECSAHFTATDRDTLRAEIAEHVKKAHNVETATGTLVDYLEATSARDTTSSPTAR